MGELLKFYATLEDAGECPACGVRFAMPANLLSTLRSNKKSFYCPNGHSMSFTEGTAERLERELKAEKEKRERAEAALSAARTTAAEAERSASRAKTKLRNLRGRVKNGVCPCCQRSFVQLARHMATKHPGFAAEGEKKSE